LLMGHEKSISILARSSFLLDFYIANQSVNRELA